MFDVDYHPRFVRDVQRLTRRGRNLDALHHVINLIVTNTPETRETLRVKHKRHKLQGKWNNYLECHITYVSDDWLIVWRRLDSGTILLTRTGTHDEIFGQNNTKAPPPLPRLD